MRRKVPLFGLVVAAAAALLPLSPAGATTAAPAKGTIAWSPCPEDANVECGTLSVPVDWSRPNGPTVDLALARRKATDPSARAGSLLINPGGPGGSGVDFALFGDQYFSKEINSRFDIVGFDPRGVARSHPIVCSTDLLRQAPYPIMKSQADFDRQLAYNSRLRADCRARTGPLYDHVDTLSVVRDLDAIRAALGEDKLTYYGISYGTLIGQLYAETFPERVRALALDGNMDHSLHTRGFLDTEAATVQDSFDEFVSWCDREASCALHGRDVRAFWAGLLARADRGELHFPGQPEAPLTRLDLIGMATGAFYGPAWAELARFLNDVDTGTAAAPFTLRSPKRDADVTEYPTQVFCEDFSLPVHDYREYAALLRRSARIAPDMRFSPLALSMTTSCLGQPTPIPNPQHHLRVHGSAPLLLGNSVHDPATAYSWAVSSARQIGREATLLTYDGWGHGIYGHSDCTTGTIDSYLVSLALPARGTHCPAVEPPAQLKAQRPPLPLPPGPLPAVPGWGLPRS
ncbi:alpha/beta hydrolase [Sphaerisporangium fuscum]|uniref:alpha/beta hydrolase n=1 Tax=Sphaerisporangium fuscum TaxID=2835868 RepID=UPI001BDC7799|nr:alpha/beta hydrolase [Sphaerisporangium fuscum]